MKHKIALLLSMCLAFSQANCNVTAGELNGTNNEAVSVNENGRITESPNYMNLQDSNSEVTCDVHDSASLEEALNEGAGSIRIVSDFIIDRTFYIDHSVSIYSTAQHTLTRSKDFGKEIFVVGEDKTGRNVILDDKKVDFSLGSEDCTTENLLVIDGNKDDMQAEVSGSVLFICNSATTNIYKGVTIKNCFKTANDKTSEKQYHLPYPERIGGAVAIVANGILNIYGGEFIGNSVNNESGDNSEQRISSLGSVIFNYSCLNIYDGEFSNNSAARGGTIYNYRMASVTGGLFKNNTAEKYGGVVYQAESQFGQILLGSSDNDGHKDLIFDGNTAYSSGGVIFSQTKNAVVIAGNTTFKNNSAKNNGGAINISGTLTVHGAEFICNTSESKGGAIYIVNSDPNLKTRIVYIENTLFKENKSGRGGAIGVMADEDTYKEGGKLVLDNCQFELNKALPINEDNEGKDYHGGAIYMIRRSTLKATKCSFKENSSDHEGGAIYLSSDSEVSLQGSVFEGNKSISANDGCGGAISVHSAVLRISDSVFEDNYAGKNAGALYTSYVGTSEKDSDVKIESTSFKKNSCGKYGGAVYVTSHINGTEPLKLDNTSMSYNKAQGNGGALYITDSKVFAQESYFNNNKSESTKYGGGAVYLTSGILEADKCRMDSNESDYNAGAIALYSSSNLIMNDSVIEGNIAKNKGGAIYTSGSDSSIYSTIVKGNSASDGGALSLHSKSKINVYGSDFISNSSTDGNGGAVYAYQEDAEAIFRDSVFSKNTASGYGGAFYCSGSDTGSRLVVLDCEVSHNEAKQGGFLYETKTDSTVSLDGIVVCGNVAKDDGAIIYGNTKKAILKVNKSRWTDLDETTELNSTYWKKAIKNKLTVNDIETASEPYEKYKRREQKEETIVEKDAVIVQPIFDLENCPEDVYINATYEKFPRLENTSNFMSRSTKVFSNMNGHDVTADTFVNHSWEAANNPSFGEGMLIYQAMLYKKAHPEEDVSIELSTFHFCTETALCINRDSRYFGYMINLVGKEYDDKGFVRIPWLLTAAASMGIKVTIIGQIEGYPYMSNDDLRFIPYYEDKLDRPCDPAYAAGKHIRDFMNFQFAYWTSYGDDAASDMMHTKVCSISDYIDKDGIEHHNSLWASCTNLDGINANGVNGNSGMQTALIVSDHEGLYRAASNYLRLLSKYCGQEDVYEFRTLASSMAKRQIDLIIDGREDEIPLDERIVYLGTGNDDVFELYFAPFGGGAGVWDEKYNPYCKYLRALNNSEDYIWLIWNNPKFKDNFALRTTMTDIISEAYHKNKDANNKLYVCLPSFSYADYDDLEVGKDIGYKSINKYSQGSVHSKDLQMSFSENGKREYVSLLNSINIHQGSMSYQSNFVLVVKEENYTEDSVFFNLADQTSKGVVEANDFKEFLVSFEENGGSEIEDVVVKWKKQIKEPQQPKKEGYKFCGWYKDSSYITKWDFENDVVTADITLYVKWEEIINPDSPSDNNQQKDNPNDDKKDQDNKEIKDDSDKDSKKNDKQVEDDSGNKDEENNKVEDDTDKPSEEDKTDESSEDKKDSKDSEDRESDSDEEKDSKDDSEGSKEEGNKKEEDYSNPTSSKHSTTGEDITSVSAGNAKYSFDPLKSTVLVAGANVNIASAFEASSDYDSTVRHRYRTSDKKVARVTHNGKMIPKKRGEVEVICEQRKKNGKWEPVAKKLHLYIQMPEMVKKTRASASDKSLSAYSFLSKTSYSPTSWKSSNEKIAKIDENGNVMLLKKGKVSIIAVYGAGKKGSKRRYKTRIIIE